ncbi:hypothetical protein LguiB_030526 [Lonicera macranthoides]
MASLLFIAPCTATPSNYHSFRYSKIHGRSLTINNPTINFKALGHLLPCFSTPTPQFHSNPQSNGDEEAEDLVQEIRVPSHWLSPSKASQESEWLRVTLHKWLDDEYCPEATNIEISKVASNSYYKSLTEKQTDLGEILLKMAKDLERISYQESFHGAFSSANAAVSLIIQRIEQDQ